MWTSSGVTLTIAFQEEGANFLLVQVWDEFDQIRYLGRLQKRAERITVTDDSNAVISHTT